MTKDQILREIKRTAEANGGVPLGTRRFSRETGIKPYDWGQFWARWGEATREAGFEPNTFQDAYSEHDLLEKYALFVRELGRVPTTRDLRLKWHQDPEFPGWAIEKRLRYKSALTKRVAEYFGNRNGFQDAVLMCQQYAAHGHPSVDDLKPSGVELGYVYLSKSGRFYKIGKTNATGRREYELGIQLPEKITTIHVIATDDPAGIEAYWHKRFDAKRKKGASGSSLQRRMFQLSNDVSSCDRPRLTRSTVNANSHIVKWA